jgi:CcmD family protein
MMRKLLNTLLLVCTFALLSAPTVLLAQNDGQIEMADTMRTEGKIYVVVLVVAIVFTGLVLFAINSDRKIAKLEKEIKSLKSKEDL